MKVVWWVWSSKMLYFFTLFFSFFLSTKYRVLLQYYEDLCRHVFSSTLVVQQGDLGQLCKFMDSKLQLLVSLLDEVLGYCKMVLQTSMWLKGTTAWVLLGLTTSQLYFFFFFFYGTFRWQGCLGLNKESYMDLCLHAFSPTLLC